MVYQFSSPALSFRQINETDLKRYCDLYSCPKVMEYISEPLSYQQAKRSFQSLLAPWKFTSPKHLMFTIWNKHEQFQGICGLVTREATTRQAEVGIILKTDNQNSGIGSEILKYLSKFCFEQFNYNKLVGPPIPQNLKSIRIMQKAGYTKEAILRQNWLYQGKYVDTPLYTLLKEECLYLDSGD